MSLDFLLEIGTEEIPHGMIPGALAQLKDWTKNELPGATVQVDATPRRLVVRASGVPAMIASSEKLIPGPAKSAPMTAIQGFAAKHGVSADQLITYYKGNAEHFGFVKKTSGLAYLDQLRMHLPGAILAIQWPKTMYWSQKNEAFIRPIRWIVALLGDQVIKFSIAGVESGNITRGHRILGSPAIPVTNASYESELRKNFVILSAQDRRQKIENEIRTDVQNIDFELLEKLTYITEWPTAFLGDFDPAYLDLPPEVLTTVMKHHQKYFSVHNVDGTLAPHFVAVMNMPGDPEGLVKKGNERVLRARFNDARFFWDVDQQKKLINRVDDLASVTFQAKLGSYKAKTDRVMELVKELGGNAHAYRAAQLAKCDLTTEMVKEFTDLQGIVGGLYAKAQGEPEPVWRAIYEHYLPLSMEDSIPETAEGQILALADKLDTLRGCFEIGLAPTGSKDPFALRRAAQGVVKLLVEAKLDYLLDHLATGELRAFLQERVQYYFREVRGYKYDEVNAVLAPGISELSDVEERLAAIAAIRPTEDFEPLAAACKRIRNILKQSGFEGDGAIDGALLEAGPEQELADRLAKFVMANETDYSKRLMAISAFRPAVDKFFDKILVNAPDARVRANRLTLLSKLFAEFSTIADFSEIVTTGEQKS